MAANMGMGLAQGLLKGAEAFNQAAQKKQELEESKKMRLALAGYNLDDESGGLVPNVIGQRKERESQAKLASTESLIGHRTAQEEMAQKKLEESQKMNESMLAKNKALTDYFSQRAKYASYGPAMTATNRINKAGTPYDKTIDFVNRDKEALRTRLEKGGITPGEYTEMAMSKARLLAQQGAVAEGMVNDLRDQHFGSSWNKFYQKFGNDPQLIKDEFTNRMQNFYNDFLAMTKQQRYMAVQRAATGYSGLAQRDKALGEAISNEVEAYNPENPLSSDVSLLKGGLVTTSPQKQTTKSVSAQPTSQASKIRVSNGTETLLIDPSDEQSAAKDGYKRIQ